MLKWCLKKLCQWCFNTYARCFAPASKGLPTCPKRIFILRNNDRGDLLTTTPLFEALSSLFPFSEVILGVGSWNLPLVEHNPYIDRVLAIDAPWHNKVVIKANTSRIGLLLRGLWYILTSSQVRAVRALRPDIGIDVLGSPQGALLLIQARIPYRLGVRGYAGGHEACSAFLDFDPKVHVSAFALKFVSLLGKETTVLPRPQLYMQDSEKAYAKAQWLKYAEPKALRIVVAPGGGLKEKCWPIHYFQELIQRIYRHTQACIVLLGSKDEEDLGKTLKAACPFIHDAIGAYTLRESCAVVQEASYVICNPSLAMHVAAAFEKKTLVLLGEAFSDVRAHECLWSYPETHRVLGKKDALSPLPSPEQAWEAFRAIVEGC